MIPIRFRRGIHDGFTLVELLIVVSIIALLVAILLPGMRKAREQTKRAVCMSNLSQIDKAMISYAIELDSFPLLISHVDPSFSWSTWSFGGWTGRNPHWVTYGGAIFHADTHKRPVSVYMFKHGALKGCRSDDALPHEPPGDSSELPVFKCPSDSVELRQLYDPVGAGQDLSEFNSYDDVGTSYRLNWHWWVQIKEQLERECPECPINVDLYRKIAARGQAFWKRYMNRAAGRFVMLAEQPGNIGFFRKIQTIGFHRKLSWHNLAFLDGHVDYVEADTRNLSGPGWTVMDEYSPPPVTRRPPLTMPEPSLTELAGAAMEWAAAAGEIALAQIGRAPARKKEDGSEVTDADLHIQQMLIEAIHRRFLDHAVIAEEVVSQPSAIPPPAAARYCWIIDPLDGTRNYVRGYPAFATSIAVLDGGRPVVGVTRWHHTCQVFSAVQRKGAELDGRPIHISERPLDAGSLVGAQLGPAHHTQAVVAPWLDRWSVRNMGATSLHLALVASGGLAAAYAKDCWIWDLAAGAILISEAGGVCTRTDGRALFPVDLATCATTNYPFIAGGSSAHADLLRDLTARGIR